MKRIGVDGVRYEEFFITSFDGDVLGLYDYLTEYENLDELNHLACLLSELDQGELRNLRPSLIAANILPAWPISSIWRKTWIATEFYPGVEDDETLGRIYVEDMEAIDVPEHLLNYLTMRPTGGIFGLKRTATLPPEAMYFEQWRSIYRALPRDRGHSRRAQSLSLLPQLTVREQMAAYKEIIDGSSSEGYRKIAAKEHEER